MNKETVDIKTEIKEYIKRIGGTIQKVVKLSGGLLVLKGGRVTFKDNLAPFPFDGTNYTEVLQEQFKRIDYCLKFMSDNGISARYLAEIGKSLNTIYEIYDGADELEKAAAKFKAKARHDEEVSLLQKLTEYSNLSMPEKYDADMAVPISLSEKGGVVSWKLSEGILSVSAEKADPAVLSNFINSLIVRFLYAFPKAGANLLYCCRNIDDDANFFLTRMMNKAGGEFFFEKTKYFGDGGDKYSSDITEVIARLYNLCSEDRTLLLSESSMRSVLEYNANNPDNVQSPVLVILHDYPAGFENCQKLDYLFAHGKKYGVFFAVINTSGSLALNSYSNESAEDAEKYAGLSLQFTGEKLVCNGDAYLPLTLTDKKITELFEPLKKIKEKSRGNIAYEDVGFGTERLEGKSVTNEISVPVGKVDDKVFTMDFAVAGRDGKPVAYMIIGKPGCGKSSIIDSLIVNGSMKYSPDDLCFYLIDFKDGVSSAPYLGNAKMPHIKLVLQKGKQEEAEIILKTVIKEKERRNNLFIKNDCQNLVEYNKKADERGERHLPRIIVSIDEFHAIFKDDGDADRSQRLSDYCRQIVKEARSAGIHLVIASQNADRKIMNCVGDFISGRFCFDVANIEHAEAVLNRQNSLKVKSECAGRTGVAMVSYDAGETAKKIRGSYHSGRLNEYAGQVRNRWSNFKIDTAIVGEDSILNYSEIADKRGIYADLSEGAPIGLSYYDHKTVTLPFDRAHSTLMVTGGSDSIQTDHLLSVMIYAVKSNAQILLVDESDSLMLSRTFDGCGRVEQYTGKEYLNMLSKANAELKRRIDNRRQRFEPYFVVIHSLHMIRDFTEDRKGGGSSVPSSDGYVSLRAMREASSGDSVVEGQSTFLQMLKDASLVNNFYICFSIKPDVFPRRGNTNDVKLKIFHHSFDPSMENLAERLYNHKKLGMTCPESISLYSDSNQPFDKVRYFHYGEDERAMKMIWEVFRNED